MSIKKKILVGVSVFALVAVFGASKVDAAYVHTTTLKFGARSAQVTSMQMTLNTTACPVDGGLATGYFGSITLGAVKCFQSANGLVADGVVGPMTGAKLAMVTGGGSPAPAPCPIGYVCTPAGGGTPSTGGLSGTDGTIADVNELSQYNNEEVGEGESDVKVLGFEVEASNDGDIALKSIKVSFDSTGNTGSDHLDDYIDSVSVWQGSTKVGSADVDDFNEDSSTVSSKTITLNNAVVRADSTEKFYISVDAVGNLDSGDITGDSWFVDVDNIRFIDGSGVTTTETGFDVDGMDVPISFVTFSTSADTELKISTASDSPDAQIVIVDDNSTTDNVVLLKGKLKLEGTSDVVIDSFPVTLTTSGATDLDEVTGSVTLVIDGQEFTESLSTSTATSATVTFDTEEFELGAGDTVEFEVRAEINDIEIGSFEEGDNVTASVTSTNRNNMDVENEEGDQLSDSSEKSGTATGDAQEFRTEGISLSLLSTPTATVTAGSSSFDDVGTFTIKFKVTAVGTDVYLASVVANELVYVVDDSGVATTGGVSAVITNDSDSDLTALYNWLIEEGDSENFTLTVVRSAPPSDAGLYRVSLTGVKWDNTDDQTPDNTYSSNMDAFKTPYVSLN